MELCKPRIDRYSPSLIPRTSNVGKSTPEALLDIFTILPSDIDMEYSTHTDKKLSWGDAVKACVEKGATLAVVPNMKENYFLQKELRKR